MQDEGKDNFSRTIDWHYDINLKAKEGEREWERELDGKEELYRSGMIIIAGRNGGRKRWENEGRNGVCGKEGGSVGEINCNCMPLPSLQ